MDMIEAPGATGSWQTVQSSLPSALDRDKHWFIAEYF
jgi:hypothetical protein